MLLPSMIGSGAASVSEFDLAAENANPHGIAYVDKSAGSLYVGDSNSFLYRYSLGGLLLNRYRAASPISSFFSDPPHTRQPAIRSLTQVGDWLAVVWDARDYNPLHNEYNYQDAIEWLALDGAGGHTVGRSTTNLTSIVSNVDRLGADTAAYPLRAGSASTPLFGIERGTNLVLYSVDLGSGSAAPVLSAPSTRSYFATTNTANIAGLAPWTGTWQTGPDLNNEVYAIHLELYTNLAGILRGALPRAGAADLRNRHYNPPLLEDEITVATNALARGLTSDPSTRRIWTVSSDLKVRMYAA